MQETTDVTAGVPNQVDRAQLEMAFRGLWNFCETELGWMFFRAEWLEKNKDSRAQQIANAKMLRDFLEGLRSVPVVDECLKKSDEGDLT